jgi:DNA-binding GntR family transcriptional regulator
MLTEGIVGPGTGRELPENAGLTLLVPTTPAEVRTAHANVTDLIRSSILVGRLASGTRLVQSDLAAMMGVSVTPVREALRELVSEGLVDFDAFRGAVVHTPSDAEMRDLYELRRALVPFNVRKGVAAFRSVDREAAEVLVARMHHADDEEWVILNKLFHEVLDGASGNAHLASTLSRLATLAAMYVNVCVGVRDDYRSRACAEHEQLLGAYASGDVERAVDVNLRHLSHTIETATDSVAP